MTDETFGVLNAVYLRKIATVEVVGECTGLDADAIRAALAAEGEAGHVEDLGGQFMLSDDGIQAVLAGYNERYAPLRDEPDVENWYQRFESLNTQFLKTISAWQTGGEEEGTLDRLLKVVERQVKALGTITDTIPRYARYADRFTADARPRRERQVRVRHQPDGRLAAQHLVRVPRGHPHCARASSAGGRSRVTATSTASPSLDAADTARYGGKGAGLARMCRLGLPVPPAFVIDTEACRWARENGGKLPPDLAAQVDAAIAELERGANRSFARRGRRPPADLGAFRRPRSACRG